MLTDAATIALSRDTSVATHLVSRGSTYSELWCQQTWEDHLSVKRYYQHILFWVFSTTARRIMPTVLAFVCWAGLCLVLKWCGLVLKMPFLPLVLMGQAIALLLTLRTNQSLARLQEARTACGRAVVAAREIAGLLDAYLAPQSPRAAGLAARHLALFGWLLKAFVRGEPAEEVRATARLLLPGAEALWVADQPKPVLAALARLRRLVAESEKRGELGRVAHRTVESQLSILNGTVGTCERILGSPVPPTYTRHTSRVLLSFMLMVPIGLDELKLSAALTLWSTAFIAYVMIGIDEMGVEIEQPFRLLPLQGLAKELMEDVIAEVAPQGLQPALPTER